MLPWNFFRFLLHDFQMFVRLWTFFLLHFATNIQWTSIIFMFLIYINNKILFFSNTQQRQAEKKKVSLDQLSNKITLCLLNFCVDVIRVNLTRFDFNKQRVDLSWEPIRKNLSPNRHFNYLHEIGMIFDVPKSHTKLSVRFIFKEIKLNLSRIDICTSCAIYTFMMKIFIKYKEYTNFTL